MPLYFDDFKNNLPIGPNGEFYLVGLDVFKKNLEKHFFSEVSIRSNTQNEWGCNLVIELNCNIKMFETVLNFDHGNWGGFSQDQYSIKKGINTLTELNNIPIQIDEFSIFLEDTSIIINKICEQSISDQLENILIALSKNYFQLTKGLTEIPYEIYVPVFEENHDTNDSHGRIHTRNHTKNDYFNFWGLYFESEDDADIFDFGSSLIVKGDLYMLNE
ncbi:MAG: hypothetical protein KAJ23_09755 [Maribacter sp.]|nr:hypothetical protein [Maribacter sp.]